ncbi:MAG: 5-formyltetrahydrofolate cyclo-ligase [Thermoguttaceae bacterium]
METSPGPQRRKTEIRAEASARRSQQQNGEGLSRQILQRLAESPEYARARTLLLYLSFRSEVATHDFPRQAWTAGKRVVVPYCAGEELELFRLDSPDELTPGAMGILEPAAALRPRGDRLVGADELDLVVVPGLAFDRQCGRLGYGKGYYDRLLRRVRADAALVAVAFQCQIFAEVPVLANDVRVDQIITEETLYRRSRPRLESPA